MRRLILCAAALLLLFSRACAEETLAPAWPVPQYVEWLLETARGPLQFHGKHMVYRNLINCHYMDSMREVNDLIEQAGYERLKGDE